MSIAAQIPAASPEPVRLSAKFRRSRAFSEMLWKQWPRAEQWPENLDLCEAAAFLRVDYTTLWQACQKGRDNRARLPHQRVGDKYILRKADLAKFGRVEGRQAA